MSAGTMRESGEPARCKPSSLRAVRESLAPEVANSRAQAAPIPSEAPVMSTTLSSIRMESDPILGLPVERGNVIIVPCRGGLSRYSAATGGLPEDPHSAAHFRGAVQGDGGGGDTGQLGIRHCVSQRGRDFERRLYGNGREGDRDVPGRKDGHPDVRAAAVRDCESERRESVFASRGRILR